MKKIIYCITLLFFAVNSIANPPLQTPTTLPVPTNPGKAPLVTPKIKFKELADLSVSCTGVSFRAGTHPSVISGYSESGFETNITIAVTNHGATASRATSLRGFVLIPTSTRTSWDTPRFTDLIQESLRDPLGWELCTSETCDNSIDAIAPGATVSYECSFNLSGDLVFAFVKANPAHIFFTAAIDYNNSTVESNEGNNVSVPIRLAHTE